MDAGAFAAADKCVWGRGWVWERSNQVNFSPPCPLDSWKRGATPFSGEFCVRKMSAMKPKIEQLCRLVLNLR